MSITLQWDDVEKTILRLEIDGHWTEEQFCQAFTTGATLVRGVRQSVYGLAIINGITTSSLQDFGLHLMDQWPGNLKALILVGASGLLKDAFARANRITSRARRGTPHVVFVDTLAEAYETITYLHLKEIYAQA